MENNFWKFRILQRTTKSGKIIGYIVQAKPRKILSQILLGRPFWQKICKDSSCFCYSNYHEYLFESENECKKIINKFLDKSKLQEENSGIHNEVFKKDFKNY